MSGCAPIGSTTGQYDLANQNQPPSPVRCDFAAFKILEVHFVSFPRVGEWGMGTQGSPPLSLLGEPDSRFHINALNSMTVKTYVYAP